MIKHNEHLLADKASRNCNTMRASEREKQSGRERESVERNLAESRESETRELSEPAPIATGTVPALGPLSLLVASKS